LAILRVFNKKATSVRPSAKWKAGLARRLWREFDGNVEDLTQNWAVEWRSPRALLMVFTFNDLPRPSKLLNWQTQCNTCL